MLLKEVSGTPKPFQTFTDVRKAYRKGELESLSPLLPLLRLKGKPYTLDDHYQFEPFFTTKMPRRQISKCCRQVGKTQNTAASETLKTNLIDYFKTLFVCPRFEQVKRVSNLYIRPLVNDSLIKDLIVDKDCEQSVMQRTYMNGAIQYYSFAFLDAERVRSISADQIVVDEVQDMNWSFLPVIEQTMGGSKHWRMHRYTGTPKTLDNTIERLWQQSSMGEWATRCGCGYWNIACLEYDLLRMIGKKTTICAKCGRNINPRNGVYIHRNASRRSWFEGIHIAQPVHPYYFEMEDN